MDYKVDLRDIRFVLREQVGLAGILAEKPYSDFTWEDMDMVLQEAERQAREVVHPVQVDSDAIGARLVEGRVKAPPSFHKAHQEYCAAGWPGATVGPEVGGQGLPHVIGAAAAEMFIGACPSFFFVPGLATAAANVIEQVGTPEQVATFCKKMYTGRWGGTMCLTEAQAGSAVGDVRTLAEKDEAGGFYRISGSKIFISAGDQDITENIIHLVLARTPGAPAGTAGLSLFIVPRIRLDGAFNDVHVTAIEEKMGLHGSATCSLSFGDEKDCRGLLLGEELQGMKNMFLMMNEARIAVGIQASSQANYAYQLALAYARERIQGVDVAAMRDPNAERVAIIRHPDVRRMLLTMKAYSEGIRSLLLSTASFVDRAHITGDPKWQGLLEILTPICKAYASYRAFEVADMAIMVHGGYGYIQEYAVEGLLRNVKIAAIYEGTNGIQALDLLGRKVAGKGGRLFMTFIQWMNDFVKAHKGSPEVGGLVEKLEAAKNTLAQVTMELGQRSAKGDVYYPVLNASPYLEMFGDVVLARQLVEQAVLASRRLPDATGADARFYAGKVHTAEFFVERLLPRVAWHAAAIRSGDRSALDMDL